MVLKKEILINGRLYEVVPLSEYENNSEGYLQGYTAVQDYMGRVFPVVPATSTDMGLKYKKGAPFYFANVPEGAEAQLDAKNIIDYSKATDIKEFIETQDMVKELEKDILTSPDSIYVPPIDPNDSPAMKALKEAVIDKKIDLNKYEPRFGANYNNDKRIFNKQNISLPMLVRMCNALDIKATLTLEDQTGDIVNPINDVISVEITSVGGDDNDDAE